MNFDDLDDLQFEDDEERRKYLADLTRLKRIREEAKQRKQETAYQLDKDDEELTAKIIANAEQMDYKPIKGVKYEEVDGFEDTDVTSDAEKPAKKKSKWWIWLLVIVLLGALAYPVYGMFFSEHARGIYTVAVFGLDSREGNTGAGALSDVNILAQINQDTGEIKLVSIYRDTYVQILEDDYYHKFNQAYHKGGPEQSLWTLQHNMDITPDDYAAFNWKTVVEGINLLGGIDLEITDKEFAYINGFITETVNSTGIGSVQLTAPGMQHLDGVQAVAYARLRLMDNDFKRTERQRKIISLCLEKAKQTDVGTLIKIAEYILPQINTSIEVDDILPLIKNLDKLDLVASKGWPFENECRKIGSRGSCVVAATLESNVCELHKFLLPEKEYKPSDNVHKCSVHIEELTGVHQIQPETEAVTESAEN